MFLVLLLAPDLGAVGYLLGPRIGAAFYDTAHLEALPIALAVVGVLNGSNACLEDRTDLARPHRHGPCRGYGLKYPTSFKDTHLQRV